MDEFKVPAPKPKPVVVEKSTETEAEPAKTKHKPKSAAVSPYQIPKWSNIPSTDHNYNFEVLKSGQIIDKVQKLQRQAFWSFGRLPENDVAAAHPTISRFHAVLQYKPKAATQAVEDQAEAQPEGWYIYDLGSTHGTFLNKQRVPPKVYIRMRVGHMLKLGGSSRAYILEGPQEDEEPETELTVTEMREQREQLVAEAAAKKQRQALDAEERDRNEGVSWGMQDDADEETDLTHNPFASTNNEELFFDDPKRTLRGFFEREGLQLEYKCDELSQGSFVCRVELPLDDSNGRPIIVEVTHKGRKKDCVVQCALESCRTLDRHGVLRQANQESQKRKIVKAGNSDDEDEFWDRTGEVARKKQRKTNAGTSVTLTYEDLLKQEGELLAELEKVELEIAAYQQKEKRLKELATKQQNACDDLDNFMDTLSENVQQVDKTEIKKLRLEQQRLKSEHQKVQRLIKIAKPTVLPFTTSSVTPNVAPTHLPEDKATKKQLPMIGKRNQFSKFKVVKAISSTATQPKVQSNAFASDEEEIEEEDEQEEAEEVAVASTAIANENAELTEKPIAETEVNKPTSTQPEVIKEVNVMTTEAADSPEPQATNAPVGDDTHKQSLEEAAQKKSRQRQRQRNKQRQDVDMELNELAEHEDTDKYAKWVPPTNQSGDGITHLNEKFGY